MHCQNGGSELPNEVTGQLVTGDNVPAARVRVDLYSVNYIPADSEGSALSWSTLTDAGGRYAFQEIPQGRYNVMALQDSLGVFRDSVSISGAADLGRDTLGSLGRLSGTVGLQPQDDPRNAVVQVMGTDTYVNVSADGSFTLAGLAGGWYRLRVFVGLPNYIPLFTDVRIGAGAHDTLESPLVPFFSGLPVVTGIRAELDTANGVAKISWAPVEYPALLTYLIYRDPQNAVNLAGTPLNDTRVLDTVYFDTLYRRDWETGKWSDSLLQKWEYRVAIKASNGETGETFEAAPVSAISPSIFQTSVTIDSLATDNGRIFRGDTVRIEARYSNQTFSLRSLHWVLNGSDTLRNVELNGHWGADTLTWVAPDEIGDYSLHVEVRDERDINDSTSTTLQVVPSRIIGEISYPSADIDAYAWEGNIVHVSPDTLGNIVVGLFDIADGKDTVLTEAANLTSFLDTSSSVRFSSAFWGSALYLIHAGHPDLPGASSLRFDVATGEWSEVPPAPGPVLENGAVAADGKLYAVLRSGTFQDSATLAELDLSTGQWTARSKRRFSEGVVLSAYDGKVYVRSSMVGPFSSNLQAFDPATNTWSDMPVSSRFNPFYGARLVGLNGSLYTLGGQSYSEFSSAVDRYDLNTGAWVQEADCLYARGYPGVVAIGSSLYILGGQTMEKTEGISLRFDYTRTVEEYRP